MARLEQESLSKKSSKFDNFLKKNLDEQTFHRIRGYEACIVCSEKENKAFKFVVLSDEQICFTENPPKTITKALRLADVLSVELSDALPEFLSGQEQLNTQHIVVTYEAGRLAGEGQGQNVQGSSSLAALREDEEGGSNHDGDESTAATMLQGGKRRRDVETARLSQSMPAFALKSLLKGSRDDVALSSKKKVTISAEVVGHNDSLPSSLNQRQASRSADSFDDSGYRPATQAVARRGAASATEFHASIPLQAKNSTVAAQADKKFQQQPMKQKRLDSVVVSSTVGGAAKNEEMQQQRVMHLYMLSSTSTMFSLLQSAASNCIIRSTMMLDVDYRQRAVLSPRSGVAVDKVEMQFACLATELMDPDNSVEQTFMLMQELKVAAEKDFYLKKLFWRRSVEKSPDVFAFMVRLLQRFLPRSPITGGDTAAVRARRADEFELVILTAQTLELMFRETEILPARLRVLRFGGGRVAADLIAVLTCFPDLPTLYVPSVGNAAVKAAVQSEAAGWQCLDDLELHELLTEFTNTATAVLFEMILIAEQANWGESSSSFFNVSWMMRIMEDLSTMEKFLERLIGQAMRMVQPSRHVRLSPQHAVLLFEQFVVLRTIITNSPYLAAYIRNSYTEEFKYYIQAAVLDEKLPSEYPITRRTVLLIEEVISAVLQKRFSGLSLR